MAQPKLFKEMWPKREMYEPHVSRLISRLVGWEHIHEIFSAAILFRLSRFYMKTAWGADIENEWAGIMGHRENFVSILGRADKNGFAAGNIISPPDVP